MFAKLLKYDMKATSKIGVPTVIAVIIGGIIGFLACSIFAALFFFMPDMIEWNINVYATGAPRYLQIISDVLMPIYILSIFASLFATFVVLIFIAIGGTVILVITVVNFYKSLLTDEGYLSFTLPVSPTAILCSKLTNSVIWNIIVSIAQIVAGIGMFTPFIALGIAQEIRYPSPPIESIAPAPTVYDTIEDVIAGIGGVSSIITGIILALVMIIVTQLLYFFAVFLGGVIARKHKLLFSAGFVVLAHIIFTTIQQGVQFFVTAIVAVVAVLIGTLSRLLEAYLGIEAINLIISSTMTIISPVATLLNVLIFGVIAIVLFVLTNYLMNKKLNLP